MLLILWSPCSSDVVYNVIIVELERSTVRRNLRRRDGIGETVFCDSWPMRRTSAAGVVGAIVFLLDRLERWRSRCSIRLVKEMFDESDAGLGLLDLLSSTAWAGGVVSGGGLVMERSSRAGVLRSPAA